MYKKKIAIITTLFLIIFSSCIFAATEEYADLQNSKINVSNMVNSQKVNINLDGNLIDFTQDTVYPFIYNNNTFVPLRIISETLGADVSWDSTKFVATIKQGDIVIEIPLAKDTILMNKNAKKMDVSMKMGDDNKCYVPLRFTSEVLGCSVNWDNTSQTVYILTEKEKNVSHGLVGKVNNTCITQEEYQKILAMYIKNYELESGLDLSSKNTEKEKNDINLLKEKLLEQLIMDNLLYQDAIKNNIQIDEQKINTLFDNFITSAKANKEFNTFLKDNRIDDTFIKNQIRKETIVNQYKDNYIKKLDLSDKNLELYYKENINNYKRELVNASHILIKTVDDNFNPLSEETIKEARSKTENILTKVKSGEDFAKAAKEYSEDPGSALSGGNLGYFSKGLMVPEFEKAAFSLKNGEISDIVQTKFGYHIIKVHNKKEELLDFEKVKENIKTKIQEQELKSKIEKLKKEAKVYKFLENIKGD